MKKTALNTTHPYYKLVLYLATGALVVLGVLKGIELVYQGVGFYQSDKPSRQQAQVSLATPLPKLDYSHCPQAAGYHLKMGLDMYRVKEGDTLESITTSYFGSPERSGEVVKINAETYPGLSTVYSPLVAGWVLLMPPKEVSETSGMLFVKAGSLETRDGVRYFLGSDREEYGVWSAEQLAGVGIEVAQRRGECFIGLVEGASSLGDKPRLIKLVPIHEAQKRVDRFYRGF